MTTDYTPILSYKIKAPNAPEISATWDDGFSAECDFNGKYFSIDEVEFAAGRQAACYMPSEGECWLHEDNHDIGYIDAPTADCQFVFVLELHNATVDDHDRSLICKIALGNDHHHQNRQNNAHYLRIDGERFKALLARIAKAYESQERVDEVYFDGMLEFEWCDECQGYNKLQGDYGVTCYECD